ncbi:zinc finger protein 410 isoform 2-T3 [Anomaloglossus baeobatrachus]|uniref:zinc finger protein 410 isoform X2 n=1 Tax=Anomaloglossus baeobatrachus TaxID=238106 RepID=UPI003F4FFC2E
MLSDEPQSKPEFLVEFVQNASIPLGDGLVGDEAKDLTCLTLLPEPTECDALLLGDAPTRDGGSPKAPDSELLAGLQLDPSTDSRDQKSDAALLSPSTPSSLLQDLPASDSSSFILLNLARSGLGSPSEHMVFVQDEAEDSGNGFLPSDCTDSSTPWFLRVQELAHDSLIAATRAQLAKHAKSISNVDASLNSTCEVRATHPEKRLRCSFHGCERSFVRPTHLRYHLKTHINDRSFTCPAEGCGKSFYVLQRLNVHMRTHNGERPFLCPEPGCQKQFTTAGNLKNHLRVHTGERPFLCDEDGCGRSFAEYSSLRKHLVVHSGAKSHRCPVCSKTFSQSGSRNAHIKKHHPLQRTDAPTRDGGSPKAPDSELLAGLQLDPSTDSRDQKSDAALLSPSTPSSLLQDLPASDSSSFILLNLARSGLGSPSEHMVFVQDEAEDSGNGFLPSDCTDSSTPWFLRVQELAHDSLIAATRAQLAKHAKSISNADASLNSTCEVRATHPEKRLRCSFHGCERSFVRPTHLRYHLKTHINDRSFTCPAEGCGKSFYVLQRLNVHMRTHNGERPFLCPEPGCQKQFTTAGNLKNHLRVHTGERPFLCDEDGCGRSFAEYSSLRKHLVVHSGAKSHRCPVCSKTFSQSGSRNAHIKKHHPLQRTDPSTAGASQNAESLTRSHLLPVSYGEESTILLN